MTTTSRRSRSLIGRTPVGVPRVTGAHVSVANLPPHEEVEELEALSVDDFDDLDDDDDDDDDEYEDDDSEESAPARVGIRLGAARPPSPPPAPAVDDDDDDDTLDPDWALPSGVDVVESYRQSAFESEGKALDSEVMIQSESESPFEVSVEPTDAPSRDDQVVEERDRALPVLALMTSTFGLMAGAVLGGIGLVAMISIFSAFDAGSDPTEAQEEPATPEAEVPSGEVLPDGDAQPDEPTSEEELEEAIEEDVPAEEGAAPAPAVRRKKVVAPEPEPVPEPVAPVPVAPAPKPAPVATPEPEPEDDEKKGLFRKKKK